MRVRLQPMSEEIYKTFKDQSIKDYADGHIRDGQWSASEAFEQSAQEFSLLLPQGTKTPDHHLFTITDNDTHRPVGILWYGQGSQNKTAYLYDIRIDEEARGQGYGTEALVALEEDAKKRGATSISLHVFGHNPGALRLYQRAGYRTTNIMMAKDLE